MTLSLHGETVTINQWHPIARGHYKEYKAYFTVANPDGGKPIPGSVTFDESVAGIMREAGYNDMKWIFSHKTFTVSIDVILGTRKTKRGEVYSVSHVYAPDGTAHGVEPTNRRSHKTKAEWTPEKVEVNRMKYLDPATRARLEKKAEQDKRFAHGETLHAYRKASPFSLIVVGGEWELFKKPEKRAA